MPLLYETALENDRIGEFFLENRPLLPNIRNKASMTPLMIACKHKSIRAVRQFLKEHTDHEVDLNGIDAEEWTALHHAVFGGSVEIIRMLKIKGAEINATTNKGHTSLHLAAKEGCDEICNVLLQHGAKIEAIDEEKKTPLHLAAIEGYEKVCNALVQHGA